MQAVTNTLLKTDCWTALADLPFPVFMDASLSLKNMIDNRNTLSKTANDILDTYQDDKGEDAYKFKGSDDESKVNECFSKISSLDSLIEARQKNIKINDSLEERATKRKKTSGDSRSLDEIADGLDREEQVFGAYLRGGKDEARAMSERFKEAGTPVALERGTDSKGGYTTPDLFSTNLLEAEKHYGSVQKVADSISTDDGNIIDWATVDETNEEGEIVGENISVTTGDPSFGTTQIGAYKFSSKNIVISVELLQDNRVNLLQRIPDMLGKRLARGKNKKYTIGSGTNEPQGVLVGSSLGTTRAAFADITYDELVDLEHSLDPAYRMNASWMFHDDALKILKKMKDDNGLPLWRPGVIVGDPNQILGYNYEVNQHLQKMVANSKAMLFGDFSKYLIRNVNDIILHRFDDSKYAEKGQVGFLAFSRSDGKVIAANDQAIKHMAV